jgi:hypothetical protein
MVWWIWAIIIYFIIFVLLGWWSIRTAIYIPPEREDSTDED